MKYMNGHALNWFEIPVSDFYRAKNFYETLFNLQMPMEQTDTSLIGYLLYGFKGESFLDGRGGAIVYNPELYTPSANGTLVYLNCDPDLNHILNKVAAAGGKVLMEKTIMSPDLEELGYWALILDSEGNRVALHSMK